MPQQPDQATFQQMVLAHAAARKSLDLQARATASAAVRGLGRWYSTDSITAWARDLVQRMTPIHRVMASTTDAYLSRSASLVAGRTIRPVGGVNVAALRNGITAEGAYARAADTFRWQQSRYDAFARDLATSTDVLDPPDLQDPIDAAIERILSIADLDSQLVHRDQSQAFYETHQRITTGWRRVVHPELSAGGSCGLCIVISDRLYGPTEPLEVHDECKCTTLAVVEGADPGSQLNDDDLKRFYADAGGTSREALKGTRYQVHDHGELGRVLTFADDHFRTNKQAQRDKNESRQPKSPAEQRATLERVLESQQAALPKAREFAAADPERWGRYLDKLDSRVLDLQQQLLAA